MLGALFLGEKPAAGGIAGVAIIIAGSVLLNYTPGGQRGSLAENIRSKGVWFRLLSILLFCIGVIFLKRAVLESSPFIVLFFWAALGFLISAAMLVFRTRTLRGNVALLRRRPLDYAGVCVSMTFTQSLTLVSFGLMFVGYAIALFQLASLPDVFIGRKFFGERYTVFRLAGASVMIAGALLIAFQI